MTAVYALVWRWEQKFAKEAHHYYFFKEKINKTQEKGQACYKKIA